MNKQTDLQVILFLLGICTGIMICLLYSIL
jgi:hypothetical protein